MPMIEPAQFALVFTCLALGGVLKGATGAGAPVLAVPALAAVFDVKLAVVIMMMPNLLTNIWQAWQFRAHRLPGGFGWILAAAGGAGVIVGTVMLATLRHETLSLIVAFAVLAYIALRLLRPGWKLPYATAERLAVPAGIVGGVLQGSSGLSAPVSITFLNAIKLERSVYIFTISLFFVVMTATQVPTLAYFGMLTPALLMTSLLAVLPILAFMPVGAALARRLSPAAFDRAVLVLLAGIAFKLLYEAWVAFAG